MSQSQLIRGPRLVLRRIECEDAGYVYGLRSSDVYNRYLSEVRGGVDDQQRWIGDYKVREAQGLEYYYVIERHDGVRCGVVRLYDIADDKFTWGSWILDENKPPKAALESAILSFGFGFEQLDKRTAYVDVRIGNTHAEAFYRRLGMMERQVGMRDIHFIYSRKQFRADHARHLAVLNEEVLP